MAKRPGHEVADVKPVTFERYLVSGDGEKLVFEVHDKAGNIGHIAVDWLKLGLVVQLFGRAAEKGASAQLVSTFQVSEYPDDNLKVLSLQSPTGFRCDFAVRTDMLDPQGRSMPQAIAEELLRDTKEERQRPN